MKLHSFTFAGIDFATLASQSLRLVWLWKYNCFHVMQFRIAPTSYGDCIHGLAMPSLGFVGIVLAPWRRCVISRSCEFVALCHADGGIWEYIASHVIVLG